MLNKHDINDMRDYPQPYIDKKGSLQFQQAQAIPSGLQAANLMKGTKHDQDKLRMDLIDAKAMEGLAAVLTFGANKYAAHNWRNGINYSRILAAMLRHISAIQRGEYIDPESGLPHINHVGCCWMFLSNFMAEQRDDLNDLWKPSANKESLSR